MNHSFYLILPLALATTPVLAAEILTQDVKCPAALAEMRYRILRRVAVALAMLLVVSSLMRFDPGLGAIIAEYNQF